MPEKNGGFQKSIHHMCVVFKAILDANKYGRLSPWN